MSREQFKQKFDKLGVEVYLVRSVFGYVNQSDRALPTQEEIFGSAYASVAYLKYNLKFPKDKKAYIIGEAGLERELELEGIQFAGGTVSPMPMTSQSIS